MTRPSPSPLAVAEPWDLVAEGYTAESSWVMQPISLAALDYVHRRAPETVSSEAHVVDVAAGPGTLTLDLAPRVREVHALDFSESMLAELTRRVGERGLRNVHAISGDGMALPYDDARFDAAFSLFGLMFFPDRARGFSELRRVLRPNGVALVSSWAPLDVSPLMDLMFGALRAADPEMPPPTRNLLSLENPELFAQELEAAGFVDVSVTPHEHSVAIEDSETFWNVMTRSAAPLLLMRRRLGEDEWARRSELSRAFLQSHFGGGPLSLSTTAYFGFGRKPRD